MTTTQTDREISRDRLDRYVESWNRIGCRTYLTIVGCGKDKAGIATYAMDLYRGDLTRKRIQIALDLSPTETTADHDGTPFMILSALHGLVGPTAILDPYDVTIATTDRAALVARVRAQLISIGAEHGLDLNVEAGRAYREILEDASEGLDVRVSEGRVTGMVGRAKATGRRILDWHTRMEAAS